jgi:hypothetical protein
VAWTGGFGLDSIRSTPMRLRPAASPLAEVAAAFALHNAFVRVSRGDCNYESEVLRFRWRQLATTTSRYESCAFSLLSSVLS